MMVRLKLEIDLSCAINKYLSLQVFNKCKKSDLLNQTQQHKMCVWYAKGVFNMKF